MRLEIIPLQKLDRVCRHQRQVQIGGQIHSRRNQAFLLRLPARMDTLHFEVKRIGEQAGPVTRPASRLFDIALCQRLADVAKARARQCNQPVSTNVAKHLPSYLGTPAHTWRQISARQQLTKLQVPLMRAAEQQHPVRTIRIGLVGQKDVTAKHRLDALSTRRGIELDQSEEIGEIGQRQCGHAVRRGACNGVIKTNDAVGDRVFAVQTEMDKAGFRHPGILLRRTGSTMTSGIKLRRLVRICNGGQRVYGVRHD